MRRGGKLDVRLDSIPLINSVFGQLEKDSQINNSHIIIKLCTVNYNLIDCFRDGTPLYLGDWPN